MDEDVQTIKECVKQIPEDAQTAFSNIFGEMRTYLHQAIEAEELLTGHVEDISLKHLPIDKESRFYLLLNGQKDVLEPACNAADSLCAVFDEVVADRHRIGSARR